MALASVCKAGGFLRSFHPVSIGFLSKTSVSNGARFCKNTGVVRSCSGGVLQRIETKQKEALVGGGQKRIDTQHRKVRFNICMLHSCFRF